MTAATLIARGFCLYILLVVAWLIYGTAVEKVREIRAIRAWHRGESWDGCQSPSHPACRDRAGAAG